MNATHLRRLFLDDMRDPPPGDHNWIVVRSTQAAIDWCEAHGAPDFVAFDHDLGLDDTGMAFAKWLIECDIESEGQFLPRNFAFSIHSMNPVGRENLQGLMGSYLAHRHQAGPPSATARRR